jgi:asparagine synthase (glutamine-hydrolysing)
VCGIAAVLNLSLEPLASLGRRVAVMGELQRHRGPDGEGAWLHPRGFVGLGHRRLSVIDLESGHQPMGDPGGNWITYNGETYNYRELREQLSGAEFVTRSDAEVLLHAYRKWGLDCLSEFRGMFAFVLWDESQQTLFCARDRFGIKPLYYAVTGGVLYLASEIKALLPFLPAVETDLDGFRDYLTFQFCLAGKTLFKGVNELPPGQMMLVRNGTVVTRQYWDLSPRPDLDHTAEYFEDRIRSLLEESVGLHLRSDVPVGAYVSGGLDSSIVAALAARRQGPGFLGFTGKFSADPACDESRYARALAAARGFTLHEVDITAADFVQTIEKVVYHLDCPVAGPGSFPQYVVSGAARRHCTVLLGGQGGDEIFGGYARYLIAHFEQCIKAAIDGTAPSAGAIVTYESIRANLGALREYKPLLQEFWREGLFEDPDRRYFRLIDRSGGLDDEINWAALGPYSPFETFREIFRGHDGPRASYFDAMTRFDFKTLLPALLHVEDRVSMAHGLEARVPLLDHSLVELVATIPAGIKFKDGTMKRVLRSAMGHVLPVSIVNRRDKMGFPVPLHDWLARPGPVRDFVIDVFSSRGALARDLVNGRSVVARLDSEPRFGRKVWGLLCLELWQRAFHDQSARYRHLVIREVLA